MRVFSVVATTFALVAMFGACSAPEEPKGLAKPAAATCGGFVGPTGCATCTSTSCCDVATTCRDDAICRGTYDCLGACKAGDDACHATCTMGSSAALVAMTSCRAKSCGASCGASCGDVGLLLPTFVTRSAGCASCVTAKVCPAATTCASDSACVSAAVCRLGCNALDGACIEKCAALAGPAGDLTKSVKGSCGAECEVGRQVGCSGNVAWPKVAPGTTSVRAVVTVSGAGSPVPVVGAEVTACGKVDVDCLSPVAASVPTDAAGRAELTVAVTEVLGGFNGLFRVTATGYMPTLAFYNPPLAGDQTLPTVPILKTLEFMAATGALGVVADPERGHLIALVEDCELNFVPGATVDVSSADGSSTVGYFQGGFPTKDAKLTDGTGLAGAFNLPPGTVTVNAKYGGKIIATGQALVKKGTITQLSVVPSP